MQSSALLKTGNRGGDILVAKRNLAPQGVPKQELGDEMKLNPIIKSCHQKAIYCRRRLQPASAQARRLCHLFDGSSVLKII